MSLSALAEITGEHGRPANGRHTRANVIVKDRTMSEEHNDYMGKTLLAVGLLVAVLWVAWFIIGS